MSFCPQEREAPAEQARGIHRLQGTVLGINTAHQECDMTQDIISKMQYEGESRNWNRDKHCAKSHQKLAIIAHVRVQ